MTSDNPSISSPRESSATFALLVRPYGHTNAPKPQGQKSCDACAHPRARGDALPRRAPRDHTPRQLAEKILQSRSALEGERKQVTVLFIDLKGSMEPAEQVDPEWRHAILNCFFQILADGVHRFEGTMNPHTGDGIMALFGAPIAHEDHAQHACYAALHLRDAFRRAQQRFTEMGAPIRGARITRKLAS